MSFQKVTESDVDRLIALEKSVSDLKVYSAITDKDEILKELEKSTVYLVQDNNETVGSVWYEMKDPTHAYLSGLVVEPRFQGKGLGRAILEKLLREDLKTTKRIDLVTHPENSSAIVIYLKLGFIIEGWKENYYGDGEPRIVLALIRN